MKDVTVFGAPQFRTSGTQLNQCLDMLNLGTLFLLGRRAAPIVCGACDAAAGGAACGGAGRRAGAAQRTAQQAAGGTAAGGEQGQGRQGVLKSVEEGWLPHPKGCLKPNA